MPFTFTVRAFINSPEDQATVGRAFRISGRCACSISPTPTFQGLPTFNYSGSVITGSGPVASIRFERNNTSSPGTNWEADITISDDVIPWGSTIQMVARIDARVFALTSGESTTLSASDSDATVRVAQLPPAIPPLVSINSFASPIVAERLPVSFTFEGTASSPQATLLQNVQYRVESGPFFSTKNLSGDWSRWSVSLPLPPTPDGREHVLSVRAIDRFGVISGEVSSRFRVLPATPIVIPPDAKQTLSGAPTTSSITSWTRLEPDCSDEDMERSSSARLFDPLWMLTRQWQLGEFQAEDAGTPIKAGINASSAAINRYCPGELTSSMQDQQAVVSYDRASLPLEVLVERRRMRAVDSRELRSLRFAIEAGQRFLRMLDMLLEQHIVSKSYRAVMLTKLALRPLSDQQAAIVDAATRRYFQTMQGRAPDGRILAELLRTQGPAQFVGDSALNIVPGDKADIQLAVTDWLTWYDNVFSEPSAEAGDAWNAARLEYALSVGARFSSNAADDMTFSASEADSQFDWSSFDVNTEASITSGAIPSVQSLVELAIPAPLSFPGGPAPRFWEMEDASLAYGLMPVGPTDLAHLMMIEYAGAYGNDWYAVPLSLPVGSVTRVDSLVVTDTFGVRSLLRPIGDPSLPPPFFSMWQSALQKTRSVDGAKVAINRFLLPPTLHRSLDSAALEDVSFIRDEMANVAWAIERIVENPIERPLRRAEAQTQQLAAATSSTLAQYLLSSNVPAEWIPLLPVQLTNPLQPNVPGQFVSRLKRGAVRQLDGSHKLHEALGQILHAGSELLLFDEEVPREGVQITRQRRYVRWIDGSTWLWMALRNQVGRGEGSSALQFDQVTEPSSSGPRSELPRH